MEERVGDFAVPLDVEQGAFEHFLVRCIVVAHGSSTDIGKGVRATSSMHDVEFWHFFSAPSYSRVQPVSSVGCALTFMRKRSALPEVKPKRSKIEVNTGLNLSKSAKRFGS